MFKFFGWLFNMTNRHYKEVHKYQTNGYKGRIYVLILTLVLAAATVGLEYWFSTYLLNLSTATGDHPVIALIGIGLLTVAVALTAIDFSTTFTYVGFKMAIVGTVLSTAQFVEKKVKNKKQKNLTEEENQLNVNTENQEPSNEIQNNSEKIKTYKIFDICFGIFQALLVLFIVASLFLCFPFIAKGMQK